MAHYLSEHPDVFMCPEKEPHYFNTDLNHKRGRSDDLEEYLNLFAHAREEKIIGEASVWYLYSREAVQNILEFNPEAKFVVMIRNPLQMTSSLHQQIFSTGRETEKDFNTAWFLQEERSKGKKLPVTTRLSESKMIREKHLSLRCRK